MTTKLRAAEFIDRFMDDVRAETLELIRQYRAAPHGMSSEATVMLLKQAVDTPHRARARLLALMSALDSRLSRSSTAQDYLDDALRIAGSSKSMAGVLGELEALESQTAALVQQVKDEKWTWEQVADALESELVPEPEMKFDYRALPIPKDYKTIWGDKY